MLGPLAITSLGQNSVTRAINDLVSTTDPQRFAEHFGAPLTAGRTSCTKFSHHCQIDGNSANRHQRSHCGLYNSTMILMALLLAIALVSNALMKPVDPRHHIKEEPA